MRVLKRYQEKAIEKLKNKTRELLEEKKEKATIIFQSPTGSGKTFMISRYIEELIKEYSNDDICFLWISIGAGSLHKQSYFSLKNYFGEFPPVYLLEREFHGGREKIEKNEVVIVNWDKINQKDEAGDWTNSLMKDSEKYNFRDVLENTKKFGTKIIMIIDESHTSANTKRAKELRDDVIKADLTIEMSATPVIDDYDDRIMVNSQDVIEEGMIKKEIIVNEGINKYISSDIDVEELILKSAYSKRFDLAKIYKEENIDVNPLCLIQIPNGKEAKEKQEKIEDFLAKNGATIENGKVAVWLSEDKINLEMLNENENRVEFLIFKQAIATGWDCPRAQVLVKFRDKGSEVLEIQTVGRILRMPEGEHYNNDKLNKAYIYLNVKEFSIKKEEYNPNIIKSLFSKRKEIYGNLKLRSYYLNRVDYGDVTKEVFTDLEKVFCEYFDLELGKGEFFDENRKIMSKKIDFEKSTLKNEIIFNEHLNTIKFDSLDKENINSNNTVKIGYSEDDYDNLLLLLIEENLNGFAKQRSRKIILNAILRWFRKYLGIDRFTPNNYIIIRDIILSNYGIFSKLLDKTTYIYKDTKQKEIENKVKDVEEWDENWEIASSRVFNPQIYKKYDYKLSLYEPCYLKFDSKIEQEFVELLEKNSDKVLWWWQNGSEHMALNFGIKYNTKSTFQPDFIVRFKDGRVGIFDTKAIGYQEDDNKVKNEALQKYIIEENQKGKNIFGGLIVKSGEHFRLNHKEKYYPFSQKEEDWEYFEI